jgi:hypothetical protein
MSRRWLFLSALALVLVPPAQASEIRGSLEEIQARRRVAVAYLRTGNPDLAIVELERLRAAVSPDAAVLRGSPDEPALAAALVSARAATDKSVQAAEGGDLDEALRLVQSGSEALETWRRNAGIVLFSDCIGRVSAAYEALDHRATRSVPSNPDVRDGISQAASSTREALETCAGEAPTAIRSDPEFERLLDGFVASLRQVPDAVAKQDGDYLHRLLIEQRSFERLLAFRFG